MVVYSSLLPLSPTVPIFFFAFSLDLIGEAIFLLIRITELLSSTTPFPRVTRQLVCSLHYVDLATNRNHVRDKTAFYSHYTSPGYLFSLPHDPVIDLGLYVSFLALIIDSNKRNVIVKIGSRFFAIIIESNFSAAKDATPVVLAVSELLEATR